MRQDFSSAAVTKDECNAADGRLSTASFAGMTGNDVHDGSGRNQGTDPSARSREGPRNPVRWDFSALDHEGRPARLYGLGPPHLPGRPTGSRQDHAGQEDRATPVPKGSRGRLSCQLRDRSAFLPLVPRAVDPRRGPRKDHPARDEQGSSRVGQRRVEDGRPDRGFQSLTGPGVRCPGPESLCSRKIPPGQRWHPPHGFHRSRAGTRVELDPGSTRRRWCFHRQPGRAVPAGRVDRGHGVGIRPCPDAHGPGRPLRPDRPRLRL